MSNCRLELIRRDKYNLFHEVGVHTHKFDELTYFLSGAGTTNINGKEYPYSPNTFAYYYAGTPHDETDPTPCDITWTHFSFNLKGLSLKEGVFGDPRGELFQLLQKLRRFSLEETEFRTLLIESCLTELIITAARLQNEHSISEKAVDWTSLLNEIDENSHTDVDFRAMALRYYYSYDRFRHIFREKFGVSPYGYLLRRRIEHAEFLLTSTDISVIDIAYACGFKSSSQFSNIFRKHIGTTPSEYRRAGLRAKNV